MASQTRIEKPGGSTQHTVTAPQPAHPGGEEEFALAKARAEEARRAIDAVLAKSEKIAEQVNEARQRPELRDHAAEDEEFVNAFVQEIGQ